MTSPARWAELCSRLEQIGPNYALECDIAEADGWEVIKVNDGIIGSETYFARDGLRRAAPPHYTTKIEDALTLLPDGWYWRCGYTPSFKAWAHIQKTYSDHTEPNKTEFTAKREYWDERPMTVAIAMCIAICKAREAMEAQG